RPDAGLCGADSAAGSLGHRGVRSRAASQSTRERRGCAARRSAAAGHPAAARSSSEGEGRGGPMMNVRPQDFPAPPEIDRLQRTAAIVGAIGIVASAVGAITSPEQFFRSYLVAFLWVLGPTLGCLGLMMIHHLSGGAWGLGVRRVLEAAARNVPLTALLFIP